MITTKGNVVNKFMKLGNVKTISDSILTPHYADLKLILNVANMAGKVDDPIYAIFNKKWPRIKAEVRGWWAMKTGAYKTGAIHTVCVQSDTWCISMLARDKDMNVDLVGLEKCLKEVCKTAIYERASVHISTILTEEIPELTDLVNQEIVSKGVSVAYYEEP